MMKLQKKGTVTRQMIEDFKNTISNIEEERIKIRKENKKRKMSKRKPLPQISIDYLLENVFIMRLLGWTVTLGRKISSEYINGYSDVVQFSKTVKLNQAILYKGRK